MSTQRRPTKKGLVRPTAPTHVDLGGVGHAVGVLADDHVAFFQTQQALGFDTNSANAECFAGASISRIPQARRAGT